MIVGSDSGKITILEWDDKKSTFNKAHEETFGKSGCRRIIPGQFLASDPRGRSVMIGAIEKQKLVYILNRDSESRLTISSPLSAHKTSCISFDMVGVDVGFENPIFAVLEVDYEEVKWEEANAVYEKVDHFLICFCHYFKNNFNHLKKILISFSSLLFMNLI